MMKGIFFINSLVYLLMPLTVAVMFDGCKVVQSNEKLPDQSQLKASPPPVPSLEINKEEVRSLLLNTAYKDYFDEDSKCRRTYNESYGNTDGRFSQDSLCTIFLSFDREGTAAKTIEVKGYDRTTRQLRVAEKSVWKAKVSNAQFASLMQAITGNIIFSDWKGEVDVYTSNSKISVVYPNETRTAMSNVDQSAMVFLPMLDAFRKLDKEMKWEKMP